MVKMPKLVFFDRCYCVLCREVTDFLSEPLVKPIITPRFAPSCSPELMQGLGKLAKEQSLLIQSHISENKAVRSPSFGYSTSFAFPFDLLASSRMLIGLQEVEWVKDLFCKQSGSPNNYTEVYDQFHLLQPNTIMAHGIYLSDEELQLFQRTGAAISHCTSLSPPANAPTNLVIFKVLSPIFH